MKTLRRDLYTHRPVSESATLHQIANKASVFGKAGMVLPEQASFDGVAYSGLGRTQRWAADLGWREGWHMRVFRLGREAA